MQGGGGGREKGGDKLELRTSFAVPSHVSLIARS